MKREGFLWRWFCPWAGCGASGIAHDELHAWLASGAHQGARHIKLRTRKVYR